MYMRILPRIFVIFSLVWILSHVYENIHHMYPIKENVHLTNTLMIS